MTLIPDKYDFPIWRGGSFYETITVYNGDQGSSIRDLSNCSVKMDITKQPKGDLLLRMSTDNGKIVLDASAGKIHINLSASETQALLWKRAKYEISITDNNSDLTDIILYGYVSVEN